MPSVLVATSGPTGPIRSPTPTSTGSLRQGGGRPPRATASTGTSSSLPDREQLRALSTVWRGAAHIAGAAAAIGMVIPQYDDDRGRLISHYDLGQATFAMMVAAADLGIGTGHSSVGDQEAARKILGVPDDHDVAYLLGIGYPADRPLKPIAKLNRRPIDEVIRRDHW
jgi:nitroreductase